MSDTGVQTDLATWLLEQLLADQVMAEHALQDWVEGEDGDEMANQTDSILVGAHLVRWNPRRVLAECDTKRRIIAEHEVMERPRRCRACGACPDCAWDEHPEDWPCETLRLMAAVYSDRPGYRDSWAPDGRVDQ
jgi:uncharacterized protein DUF6221